MRIKVKVTQEHIEQGVGYSACSCPIALAIREAGYEATVGPRYVVFPWDGAWKGREARLPPDARDFINRFDHEQPVTPFEFDLEVEE